jgi:uncharacterized protein (DUF1499 family)
MCFNTTQRSASITSGSLDLCSVPPQCGRRGSPGRSSTIAPSAFVTTSASTESLVKVYSFVLPMASIARLIFSSSDLLLVVSFSFSSELVSASSFDAS